MASLTFYTNPMSRGRIVRWMLEEVGAPYDTVILGYGAPMQSAEYIALNPMAKVPCLVHDGAVVTEAAAICAYLADAFPEAGLGPKPNERAAYHRWLFFGAGPVEAAMSAKALKLDLPESASGSLGYGTVERVHGALEGLLSDRDYVTGSRFTAADVYIGAQIGFGLMFHLMEPKPIFTSYLERLNARPAAIRARELDDAAAAAMSDGAAAATASEGDNR